MASRPPLSQPSPSFANPSKGLDAGYKGMNGGAAAGSMQADIRPRPPGRFDRDRSDNRYHSTVIELSLPVSRLLKRLSTKTPEGVMTMVQYAMDKKTVGEAVNGGGLLIVAQWEAKEGQADKVAGILDRFLPEAQREPGAKLFLISRARDNPAQFLFYELFRDEAAFKAHQESAHFKTYIAGEALPLLARRERAQYALL
jgi:quinol monooxygenase YgiN